MLEDEALRPGVLLREWKSEKELPSQIDTDVLRFNRKKTLKSDYYNMKETLL